MSWFQDPPAPFRPAQRVCCGCGRVYLGACQCPACGGFGEPIPLMACGHPVTDALDGLTCRGCEAEMERWAEDDEPPLPLYVN